MNSVLRIGRLCPIWAYNSTTGQLLRNHALSTSSRSTDPSAANKPKKLQDFSRITLLAHNQMQIITLAEAQKLAKRRNLNLVKVQQMDAKTQRPVYKLVATSEMLPKDLEELKATSSTENDKGSQRKTEKLLTVGARISEHDLASRLKNISKWLAKSHHVRVLIQCNADDVASGEKIVKAIELSVAQPEPIGKITLRQTKGSAIRFNIQPIVVAPSKETLS